MFNNCLLTFVRWLNKFGISILYFHLSSCNSLFFAARQNNWPPVPAGFPVGPCFYQDINVDIPLEFQKIVRMLYYLWMCKYNCLIMLLCKIICLVTCKFRKLEIGIKVAFKDHLLSNTALFHQSFFYFKSNIICKYVMNDWFEFFSTRE